MDITVYKTPNLLLEAAELVYSMVNQISPASLTAEGKFCIPPKAVEEIRKAACAAGQIWHLITFRESPVRSGNE